MTEPTRPVRIPRWLAAPAPGWTTSADVVVVGSGIAGLTAALRLRERGATVLLVTKTLLNEGSTAWAQGGIAAALADDDSPQEHLRDTLVAGVGLCDEAAVTALVHEGPVRVRELVTLGASFDRRSDGAISLTREGGHHRDRILHAGGDATGKEISRALLAALDRIQGDPGIEIIEHALVVDLLQDADGRVCGATIHVIGEGEIDGVGAVHCRAVILATGGLGQIYSSTTNPPVATGDGMAIALRAGAVLADTEFVQFHPTVLFLGDDSTGQQPLISEAVRGEGAFLVDVHGERFMQGVHELADLAPRDVVSRAIVRQMAATGTDHVFLDCRHLGKDFFDKRFPSIAASLRENGFEPSTDLLPVAPAQHYASGGVRTDLDGRSSLDGLYACGEVSCTGVHGANRLASNSLLEGLVFAHRIADDIAERFGRGELAAAAPLASTAHRGGAHVQDPDTVLLRSSHRKDIQHAMTSGSGVVRSADSLQATADRLAELAAHADGVEGGPKSWQTTNLLHLGQVLTDAAYRRTETRGGHVRADHPDRDDAHWLGHLRAVRRRDGTLEVSYHPVEPATAGAPLAPDATPAAPTATPTSAPTTGL